MLDFQNAGHEIGAHTKTHPDLTTLTPVDAQAEIEGSRNALLAMGASPVSSIAYPYGAYNAQVQQISQNAGLLSGRSVAEGYNTKDSDKFGLLVQNVLVGTTVNQVKSWIDTAVMDNTWLILVFHQNKSKKEII